MATVKCEFDLELKVELGREMIYLPFDSSFDSAHAPSESAYLAYWVYDLHAIEFQTSILLGLNPNSI